MHDRLFGGVLHAFRDCIQHSLSRSPVEFLAYLCWIDRCLHGGIFFGTSSADRDIDYGAIPAVAHAVLRGKPTSRVLY